MKRLLAVLLTAAVIFSLALPAFAAGTDVIIDTQTAPFPADEIIDGDLIITGDCPETVILINVEVTGTLRIEASHDVTVRLQGESKCGALEVNSRASVIGGSFESVTVNAPYLRFENANAESMDICHENAVVTQNSSVGTLTLSEPDIFVGGSGRAETAVVNASGCNLNLRCGEIQKNVEDEEESLTSGNSSIRATFDINPTVSPAKSVVNATVTFTNVPAELEGEYRLYWYIEDTLSYYEWEFYLEEGATSTLQCSVHFDGVMDSRIPVWCRLRSNAEDDDTELHFVTSTLVTGYSTAAYDAIESSSNPYMLHLIRNQGVIVVYGLDENNEYTKLVNAFACSVGYFSETALGDFELGLQMRWGSLMGDVYGQYCSQFNDNQLFHSVPYLSKEPDNIEYWEYGHLGTPASSGCVRLCTADAKWIYDHCWSGTPVKVYDSSSSPVELPVPCLIREDSLLRGWDPTDPDPDNPTRAEKVPVIHLESPEDIHPYIKLSVN